MLLDPTNTSAGDLVTEALRECGAFGVGQTPLAEDTTGALARLNWMLQEWERQRWLVWHLLDFSVVATGQQSYTFGPAGEINTNTQVSYTCIALGSVGNQLNAVMFGYAIGDTINLGSGLTVTVTNVAAGVITGYSVTAGGSFTILPSVTTGLPQVSTSGAGSGALFNQPTWQNAGRVAGALTTARPNRLESAFLRQITQSQPNQIDYGLQIIESREDYNNIALKQLKSFPGCCFYDSEWPLGNVFAWPVPQASIYELHVTVREQLGYFTSLAQRLAIPYEYYRAIVLNLALWLKSKYQIPSFPGDPLAGLAKAALAVLRNANAQIGRLQIPADMNRSGIYNIFSDRFY